MQPHGRAGAVDSRIRRNGMDEQGLSRAGPHEAVHGRPEGQLSRIGPRPERRCCPRGRCGIRCRCDAGWQRINGFRKIKE